MELLTINKNVYKIEGKHPLEDYNLIVYFCSKDDKKYLVYSSTGSNDKEAKKHFKGFHALFKIIKRSSIPTGALVEVDKKKFYIVQEALDGENALKKLSREVLDPKIYEQLFDIFSFAKVLGINLDYDPRNFIIKDNKLYYAGFLYKPYKDSENLVNDGIRLWVYSIEAVMVMRELGLEVNKERLKTVAATNKEIVLLVYEFYHI